MKSIVVSNGTAIRRVLSIDESKYEHDAGLRAEVLRLCVWT